MHWLKYTCFGGWLAETLTSSYFAVHPSIHPSFYASVTCSGSQGLHLTQEAEQPDIQINNHIEFKKETHCLLSFHGSNSNCAWCIKSYYCKSGKSSMRRPERR